MTDKLTLSSGEERVVSEANRVRWVWQCDNGQNAPDNSVAA
jgi:hypothetical protein